MAKESGYGIYTGPGLSCARALVDRRLSGLVPSIVLQLDLRNHWQ